MIKIIIVFMLMVAGWYGNQLYKENKIPFISNNVTNKDIGNNIKCITEDGRILYGVVPEGTVCAKRESVNISPNLVPSYTTKSKTNKSQSIAKFNCDGRQHCSQMTTRAEAEYFIKNCSNVKMDGDNDGIPCENDSRF